MTDTTDPQAARSLRAVLTVTVETRPDGGHYFDQADFTAHATEWVRAALKGQHAVDEVTVVDQAAELARAQAEAHQYRTALQGAARAAAAPSAPADRAAIRERVIGALREVRRPGLGSMTEADAVAYMADAVLAVLPAPADRAAFLRELADGAEAAGGYITMQELRRTARRVETAPGSGRVADEARQPETQAESGCAHRGPHPGFTCGEVDASQPYFNVRWDNEQAEAQGALLATRCDACRHTLNWHRNDVGCTVALCVCSRFQQPAA